ncbi:MAG: chromosome segregation and condensation protein ScpA [Sphingobacteriaceae bacterium]|nr:chromosome segregation and condensation protein ScpA [Sphingobacteriaceae bacterium]
MIFVYFYALEQQDSFEIVLPQFEGPFDLLLFFIERDELDIHEINLAKITNDFLDYIHQMNLLNIELASEFIFVAATLMRIKAKMLLPRQDAGSDENDTDNKESLIQKLIEYKRFKLVSEELKDLEAARFQQEKRGNSAFDLEQLSQMAESSDELLSFDLYKLMLVYSRAMNRYEDSSTAVTHTIVQYPYSIEVQKTAIANLLEINKKLGFAEVARHSENRVHFVYNFLAVLEMLQQQLISIQIGLGYNNFWISNKIAINN